MTKSDFAARPVSKPPVITAESLARLFAQRRGISLAEAHERLARQAQAPALADAAAAHLGKHFGGVWIDGVDGDRVKLALVAPYCAEFV